MIRTLTDRNLLLLTLYVITVAYILYRATNSVQDKVRIKLDAASLNKALEANNLKDSIDVNFKIIPPELKLDELKAVNIEIQNKSPSMDIIEILWDGSAITDLEGRASRVIWVIPGIANLFQPQAKSVIFSGQTLKEMITTQDALKPDSNGVLKPSSAMFDITKLKNSRNLDLKKKYANFMNRQQNLAFSLELALQVSRSTDPSTKKSASLPCNFSVEKVSWIEAVSWRPRPHPPVRT